MRISVFIILIVFWHRLDAQLAIARDTLTVIENGYVLKMPWANGLNFANASNIDLNDDGVKDLVMFDRINQFGTGRFRCFINTGSAGQARFRADLETSYRFPVCANWALLLDYNCDGREDIFTAGTAGIRVFRNITGPGGALTFTLQKPLLYTDYGGANGVSNLYVSSVGVPGIADIDGDGDLDVLTFSPQGVLIEYHRNMSMENFGSCDSLVYKAEDLCWGNISESSCLVTMSVCTNAKPGGSGDFVYKEMHAGSCLTCLDGDGDIDKDLIMGDISCKTVQYGHNTGTPTNAQITDTTMMYPNYPFKGSTTQIRISNFPCVYYVQVDGDQPRDLIATPNTFGSENTKSVWYFRNVSNTPTVSFQYVKDNLLQDEMIEVGQNAFPIAIDVNGDNKKDLLIGTFGYYNNNLLSARLTLYQNVSTGSVPVYSLITRDFGNLSAYNLNNVMPTSGDIDGDGDVDILVGTATGQIHWLENTGGAGNPGVFTTFNANPFTFTTSSAVAAPQLFDLDNDGLLDLLIGTKNGRISYYRNTGTSSAPSFSLITNFLGGIDVKGNPFQFGLDGYAVPYFYYDNGIKCLVGSVSGNIWQFDVPSTLTGTFVMLSNAVNGYNEGSQSTVLCDDLDGDGKLDLMIGNGGGGLAYFSSSSPYVGLRSFEANRAGFHLYPNPASHTVRLGCRNDQINNAHIDFFDVLGRNALHTEWEVSSPDIDIASLAKGVYFVRITSPDPSKSYSETLKLIRE